MSGALYPFVLEPREVEAIWGGDALVGRYGKPGDPAAKIGESWECWDDNRVDGGAEAGRTVAELRAAMGAALLGTLDQARIFPILTKFIDARAALSVQVHPGDDYARRVEHQPNGKTECWYVLEAEPGASIVLGWNRDTTRDEYLQRVRDGSLGALLRSVPVAAGQSFYLPAGTLHAIGAGIILYETQQASDLTYRIYDYDRRGADGKPRELHVEKAADVLDYRGSQAGALRPLDYELDGVRRRALVADPRFVLERVECGTSDARIELESMPLVLSALAHELELEAQGATVRLAPYRTALLPAALSAITVRSSAGNAAFLTAGPPTTPDALARRFARAGVQAAQSTAFLAQFGEPAAP